jgi:hypothetical protein
MPRALGRTSAGEVARFAPHLGNPHGRLHFCGEHLGIENRGMEGVMESGGRAAAILGPNNGAAATVLCALAGGAKLTVQSYEPAS